MCSSQETFNPDLYGSLDRPYVTENPEKKVPKNRYKRPDIYRAEHYGKWETSDKAGKRNKSKGVAQHTPG